jgi:hypothetical protein
VNGKSRKPVPDDEDPFLNETGSEDPGSSIEQLIPDVPDKDSEDSSDKPD